MIEQEWRVRLGAVAELDFANIFAWTTENFGASVTDLSGPARSGDRRACDGPDVAGSKARDTIMPGLRTFHIVRHGRRGRHFLLYRIGKAQVIEIGRILHEQLDLHRPRTANTRSADFGDLSAVAQKSKAHASSAVFAS
jgi:toxin ParE1/3/4